MTALARMGLLVAGCAAGWVIESRRPFRAPGPERARHVAPNLVLAVLNVLTNVALAAALPLPASPMAARWPSWIQAVAGVAVLDFFAWVAHLLLHKTSWGWRTHRVHHSDLAVDVTTAFRQHPAEAVWRVAWRLLPIRILGIPLPVVALHETLSAANALLEHANVALPGRVERVLRAVVVTPGMHKWHHSRDARETDTNYGNIFSVWDRMFGTMTRGGDDARLRFGLDGLDGPDAQSVAGLLRLPAVR
jgi:sterol desaturase/sphingolipid hydroxylase (fatty acid hydroxylase superfamily)